MNLHSVPTNSPFSNPTDSVPPMNAAPVVSLNLSALFMASNATRQSSPENLEVTRRQNVSSPLFPQNSYPSHMKFIDSTHLFSAGNSDEDRRQIASELQELQQESDEKHFPYERNHFEQSKHKLRDRIQKRRQMEQENASQGRSSSPHRSRTLRSPRGTNPSSQYYTSNAGSTIRSSRSDFAPSLGAVSSRTSPPTSPRRQKQQHKGATHALNLYSSPPTTTIQLSQHVSSSPSSASHRTQNSHQSSPQSALTSHSLDSPPAHNYRPPTANPSASQPPSPTHRPRASPLHKSLRKKVIFSLAEKQFLLRFVGEITGEFIHYDNGWSEHFSDGRLLMELWRGLFAEKVDTIEEVVTKLDVSTSLGWSTTPSSNHSSAASIHGHQSSDQLSTSSAQAPLPELRIASIIEMITQGRTEIILLIISLCVKKMASSNFELHNHLNLIVLKRHNESVMQFKRNATPTELLRRQLNYILKECNWSGGQQLSYFNELRDVRIYACLLRYLFPDLFSSELFSFISLVQYNGAPEKSAESILSFLCDLNPTRCIRAVQPDLLLSSSEMIHMFILSQLFELRSGLPEKFTTWDMMQLCFCHLQDDFPAILSSKSFAKIVNISRDLADVNLELSTDYERMYNKTKKQYDDLLKSYKNNLEEVKKQAKQEQSELSLTFDKYKEQASNQISFLKENKERLESLLEKQTIDYEAEISTLRSQMDHIRRQTSVNLIASLETENQILSQQMSETKHSMEVENAMLHRQVQGLKKEIQQQMQDIAQAQHEASSRDRHPEIAALQKELRAAQEELTTVKQQNRSLTQTVSEYRASKQKLTEANHEQQQARQQEESIYRDRYNNMVALTKEIRQSMTMRLALTQDDLKTVHRELEEILVLCPREVHWTHLQNRFGELNVDLLIKEAQHSGTLKIKQENKKKAPWTKCFAAILQPGYLVYWSEQNRDEPLGVLRLNGCVVKCMKARRSFDFRFTLEIPTNGGGDQKLKMSASMDSERREWVQHIRESTALKGLQLLQQALVEDGAESSNAKDTVTD